MKLFSYLQEVLDNALYQKYNVKSFHLRKVETEFKTDCYVVYSLVSTVNINGDGTSILCKYSIDVNFYYERNQVSDDKVSTILSAIKTALKEAGFIIRTGEHDIYDSMGDFKGLNLEFIKVGAPDEW